MTLRLSALLLGGALLVSVPGLAQTSANPSLQRERPRSAYDPGAVDFQDRQQKPSGVTTALGKVNPCNQNYGWAFDDAHIAMAQETLHSFLWWCLLSVTACFLVAFSYILYLMYERELLLDMSSHMLAQLYNAHHVSWNRADKLTKEYNVQMRRFNTQTQELWAAQKTAASLEEQKKKKGQNAAGDKLDSTNAPTVSAVQSALDWEKRSDETPDETDEPQELRSSRAPNKNAVATELSSEALEIQKLKAEIQQHEAISKAKDQKITNLRGQINKAHDKFSGQPQQGGVQ